MVPPSSSLLFQPTTAPLLKPMSMFQPILPTTDPVKKNSRKSSRLPMETSSISSPPKTTTLSGSRESPRRSPRGRDIGTSKAGASSPPVRRTRSHSSEVATAIPTNGDPLDSLPATSFDISRPPSNQFSPLSSPLSKLPSASSATIPATTGSGPNYYARTRSSSSPARHPPTSAQYSSRSTRLSSASVSPKKRSTSSVTSLNHPDTSGPVLDANSPVTRSKIIVSLSSSETSPGSPNVFSSLRSHGRPTRTYSLRNDCLSADVPELRNHNDDATLRGTDGPFTCDSPASSSSSSLYHSMVSSPSNIFYSALSSESDRIVELSAQDMDYRASAATDSKRQVAKLDEVVIADGHSAAVVSRPRDFKTGSTSQIEQERVSVVTRVADSPYSSSPPPPPQVPSMRLSGLVNDGDNSLVGERAKGGQSLESIASDFSTGGNAEKTGVTSDQVSVLSDTPLLDRHFSAAKDDGTPQKHRGDSPDDFDATANHTSKSCPRREVLPPRRPSKTPPGGNRVPVRVSIRENISDCHAKEGLTGGTLGEGALAAAASTKTSVEASLTSSEEIDKSALAEQIPPSSSSNDGLPASRERKSTSPGNSPRMSRRKRRLTATGAEFQHEMQKRVRRRSMSGKSETSTDQVERAPIVKASAILSDNGTSERRSEEPGQPRNPSPSTTRKDTLEKPPPEVMKEASLRKYRSKTKATGVKGKSKWLRHLEKVGKCSSDENSELRKEGGREPGAEKGRKPKADGTIAEGLVENQADSSKDVPREDTADTLETNHRQAPDERERANEREPRGFPAEMGDCGVKNGVETWIRAKKSPENPLVKTEARRRSSLDVGPTISVTQETADETTVVIRSSESLAMTRDYAAANDKPSLDESSLQAEPGHQDVKSVTLRCVSKASTNPTSGTNRPLSPRSLLSFSVKDLLNSSNVRRSVSLVSSDSSGSGSTRSSSLSSTNSFSVSSLMYTMGTKNSPPKSAPIFPSCTPLPTSSTFLTAIDLKPAITAPHAPFPSSSTTISTQVPSVVSSATSSFSSSFSTSSILTHFRGSSTAAPKHHETGSIASLHGPISSDATTASQTTTPTIAFNPTLPKTSLIHLAQQNVTTRFSHRFKHGDTLGLTRFSDKTSPSFASCAPFTSTMTAMNNHTSTITSLKSSLKAMTSKTSGLTLPSSAPTTQTTPSEGTNNGGAASHLHATTNGQTINDDAELDQDRAPKSTTCAILRSSQRFYGKRRCGSFCCAINDCNV